MTSRRQILQTALALPGVALAPGLARAAGYPDHAVRMIIPFPPGGAGDIVGRLIAPGLGAAMGQAIVVDNKPGGAQVIATQAAAVAPPDGYTLYLASATLGINPGLLKNLPFDTLKDFAPITVVASSPLVFVAHPSLGVSNITELVAYAKKNPGKINYASSGPGTGGHLSVEMLKYMAGIDMVHVPYKGAGPALTDLLAGTVQLMCTSPLPAMPHVRNGLLKALAMTGTKRSPISPEIPTVAEQGFPGYQSTLWYALLTQSGTPPEVRKRVGVCISKTLRDPALIEQFKAQGSEVVNDSPEQAGAFIREEIDRWTKVISLIGLKGTI